ncbi:adenosylhomocysteinase [Candidatus Micrarchaeota archaeon CG_4_10_14_0_2_um_filter_60_11]|nr:MAG: adenosylhomocysteinase [Candidatus Micrarchaeota archaeon CG1_02_60_51]PIN96404.1 MAG: adenosylhomocysteinase [Candidatus Micrarchaeota archaeon CG10_big_fil_rev_8_21_14_0_10_60_32]PIO02148.1 MAG: adenosylhomocysteinase [Candidatus Micrarchaeota archaeon CG09_land_8_20_14_0_10_60_16]PIY91597.1 MAG: adenosylhomocysteinase [Candidatus Micrarchaeota archaeon CG_4_10_14_0_8_um_filter_60_7]PIZ91205.1 MAG: adenosylhomocysteinase [Candidatus Micrarchaeota archaeon CG_4_10_14_0_2_um_filter_60_1
MAKDYKVKDESLAAAGAKRIDWASSHMPVLRKIRERFAKEKPLKGVRIAACLHVTKETAVLMRTLKAGGAEVSLCGSNPLSTQDDVAAALAAEGISVYAWRGVNNEEYYWCLNQVLDKKPQITTDDGADLISLIHSKRQELIPGVIAGQEETTTGVIRLKSMAADGALKFPVIAVNDTPTKHFFDNVYGTGQSTMDGVIRATEELIAGKVFVIAGYGYCGRGLASRARGMGASVVIAEVDPVKAIEAHLDGFRVMKMDEAAKIGDIFVTATGDRDVLVKRHFELMKDGAVIANTGHFDVEINVGDLEKLAKSKKEVKPDVESYELKNGHKLYLLAQGRLVNLACANGHPSEVMDTSFGDQALVSEWLVTHAKSLKPKVYDVPKDIDDTVAKLKLEGIGVTIDELTPEQKKYLASWQHGT